jgi:glycerol-3-phosphate dehydrogenase (NAD(P)+)
MSMIAEGYYATESAYKINKDKGAKTPIINAVYGILYEGKNPKKVIKKLAEKLT